MNPINSLRVKIDKIDNKLAVLLGKRLILVEEIGKQKKSKNLKIENKKRENEILSKLKTGYEIEIFKKIIRESRKAQKGSLT